MELRGNTAKPRLRSLALAAGCVLALGATPVFAAAIGGHVAGAVAIAVGVDEADGDNNNVDDGAVDNIDNGGDVVGAAAVTIAVDDGAVGNTDDAAVDDIDDGAVDDIDDGAVDDIDDGAVANVDDGEGTVGNPPADVVITQAAVAAEVPVTGVDEADGPNNPVHEPNANAAGVEEADGQNGDGQN